jgi:putative DNA primase/helicase
VPGGTIDLRTGALRDPRREDYISKQTAVAPDWKLSKPVFDNFLNECTRGDKALQRYLKRLAGYALTGSTREEVLIFIFGPGGNGKTKLVRTFAGIMCDYARQAPMDAFVVKRGERHSTDIAGLRDARLVTAAETEDGRRWDEALIKQLTGGDEVTARLMRQDNRSYIPQFKLLIVGNHAPDLTNVDASTRRRFRIVPFTFVPVVPDDHLLDKLRAERPAILAWMIDGGREWYQEGLGPTPACVLKETEEYFERPRPREAMDWRVLPARSESYIAYIAVNEKSAEK